MFRVGCKVAVARSSGRRWFTGRYRDLRRKIPASMRWESGNTYCWRIKGLNGCQSTTSFSSNSFSVIAIAAAMTAALMTNSIVPPSRTCNSLSSSGTTETDEIFVSIRRFFLPYNPGSKDEVENKSDTYASLRKTVAPFPSSSVLIPGFLTKTLDVELMGSQTKQETPSPTTTEYWRPPGLPILTKIDLEGLHRGKSVMQQHIDKHKHSAMFSSVIDIKADVNLVMDTIQNYADYDKMIDTVRKVKIHSSQGPTTCVEFKVSRFKLRFCILLTKLQGRNCVEFILDPHTGKVGKKLLSAGSGLWFVEEPEDRPKGYTRVWFMAHFNYGALVPKFLISYASLRALPKVTHWLKPVCEAEEKARIRSSASKLLFL